MNDERWTDDRLNDVIDAAAQRMTEGAPPRGLSARVSARLEKRGRRPSILAWQLASATLVIALAVFAIARFWPAPVNQQATAPGVTPAPAPVVTAPSTTIASNATSSGRNIEGRPRRRRPLTITIEQRSNDIPALDAPAALSMDAAPVAELRVSPLGVQELSVPPLDTEPDGKPR
jgi:hypothetical protein